MGQDYFIDEYNRPDSSNETLKDTLKTIGVQKNA